MAWRTVAPEVVKELRFIFCPSSPSSGPTRSFIEKGYKDLKNLNPKLPILIREGRGVVPQLWARYDRGMESGIRLEGLTQAQIPKAIQDIFYNQKHY